MIELLCPIFNFYTLKKTKKTQKLPAPVPINSCASMLMIGLLCPIFNFYYYIIIYQYG